MGKSGGGLPSVPWPLCLGLSLVLLRYWSRAAFWTLPSGKCSCSRYMHSSVSLKIRWPPCCSSSMTPRARYVGDKVGRGHLERAAVKEQRGEKRGKPNTEGKEGRKKGPETEWARIRSASEYPWQVPYWEEGSDTLPRTQILAGESVKAICYVFFFSPGSSPLMDLRRWPWIALISS